MIKLVFSESLMELKIQVCDEISCIIRQRKLTQMSAAEIMKTDQSKISMIHNKKLRGFSLERLLLYLSRLTQKLVILAR